MGLKGRNLRQSGRNVHFRATVGFALAVAAPFDALATSVSSPIAPDSDWFEARKADWNSQAVVWSCLLSVSGDGGAAGAQAASPAPFPVAEAAASPHRPPLWLVDLTHEVEPTFLAVTGRPSATSRAQEAVSGDGDACAPAFDRAAQQALAEAFRNFATAPEPLELAAIGPGPVRGFAGISSGGVAPRDDGGNDGDDGDRTDVNSGGDGDDRSDVNTGGGQTGAGDGGGDSGSTDGSGDHSGLGKGDSTGGGIDDSTSAVAPTPVPTPSALPMAGGAFALLAAIAWRKRRRSQSSAGCA